MKSSTQPRINLLTTAAMLTILGVAVTTVLAIDTLLQRWLALILLGGLAGLITKLPRNEVEANNKRIIWILGPQSALLLALMLIFPQSQTLSIIFYILSVEAMLYLPAKIGLFWLVGYTIAVVVFQISQSGLNESLSSLASFVGGLILFGLVSAALRNARQAQLHSETLLAQLQIANRQLLEYADQVETASVAVERNRLAREMHDTIGHHLTVAAVQLEAARKLVLADTEQASGLLATSQQQVREALNELRKAVGRLREPLEADLQLDHALPRLADSFRQASQLTIHLELPPGDLKLPDSHRLALYRAAQEGLTNVQRHAAATQAWLRLLYTPTSIQLEVEDNGRGLPQDFLLTAASLPATGSYGLRGMQERLAQLGGRLELASKPEGGTQLRVSLPFSPESNHA